jgi:hypothetical protein
VFALGFEGLPPVADEVVAEAEGACGLGDGVALLGDELNGLRLELGGVGASRSGQCWTSQGDCTPLTGCPPFVGKSKVQRDSAITLPEDLTNIFVAGKQENYYLAPKRKAKPLCKAVEFCLDTLQQR